MLFIFQKHLRHTHAYDSAAAHLQYRIRKETLFPESKNRETPQAPKTGIILFCFLNLENSNYFYLILHNNVMTLLFSLSLIAAITIAALTGIILAYFINLVCYGFFLIVNWLLPYYILILSKVSTSITTNIIMTCFR